MLTRRDFIRAMAVLGGSALLMPLDRLEQLESAKQTFPQTSSSQIPSVGELYAGFLLLPGGMPVPPIVKYPELGIPVVCGVGAGRGGPEPTAVSKSFSTAADLSREVDFPIYTFSELPEGFRSAGASLIKHETGEVFAASVDFQAHHRQIDDWETTVSIWAQPDFPRPFPLWSSDPVEPGGPTVVLEKVAFLPSPGIMVATRQGSVCHWIEKDVLYTLIAEFGASREGTLALVSSLAFAGNQLN